MMKNMYGYLIYHVVTVYIYLLSNVGFICPTSSSWFTSKPSNGINEICKVMWLDMTCFNNYNDVRKVCSIM